MTATRICEYCGAITIPVYSNHICYEKALAEDKELKEQIKNYEVSRCIVRQTSTSGNNVT
jgi:hypothetical protein